MGWEVVYDHHLPGLKPWREQLLDVGLEDLADGATDDGYAWPISLRVMLAKGVVFGPWLRDPLKRALRPRGQ